MPQKPASEPSSEKTCIHGNKQIVITYDSITLGDKDAACPYYKIIDEFDPKHPEWINAICKPVCKVTRQNLLVEKLAVEKAKIQFREDAKFNRRLPRGDGRKGIEQKEPGESVGVD